MISKEDLELLDRLKEENLYKYYFTGLNIFAKEHGVTVEEYIMGIIKI